MGVDGCSLTLFKIFIIGKLFLFGFLKVKFSIFLESLKKLSISKFLSKIALAIGIIFECRDK